MSWEEAVEEKIRQLELIASWASMTDFGKVRDLCRIAQSELKKHLEFLENSSKKTTED